MVMGAGLDDTGHDREGWNAAEPEGTRCSGADSRDSAGSDMPDPVRLAQDWITLWQSELSAMAADPEIRESWQTVTALWAGTISAMLRGIPRDQRHDAPRGRSGTADATRAAPAAAASDARDAEIDRLARHVAALERRLSELERGGDPAVHSEIRPKPKPGRKPLR
jgi:hypothetical protein